MANIQIPITSNGKTTLLTGGKYCARDIDLDVSVEIYANGGNYEGLTYNGETGEYHADCVRCGKEAIWNHLRGELPESVMADLAGVGYDLDFVYDSGADDLHMYGKWVLQDDASSTLGKAAVLDTSLAPTTIPINDNSVFIGDGASNVVLGYHSRTKLLENNNLGYKVYKWENIDLSGSGHGWLNLWDNKNFDGPTWSFPPELIDRQIDLYLSIKTTNWDNGQSPVFYIDRVIAVAYCGAERSVGTDIMEGVVTAITDKVARSVRPYAFYGCEGLTKVSLPKVEMISTYSFARCTKLESVHLPKLKSDSGASFERCTSLEHIELPALAALSAYAFNGCTNLKSVGIGTERDTVCSLQDEHKTAFMNTPIAGGTGYIYVPTDLVDEYKTAKNWDTYANQIKPAVAKIGGDFYGTLPEAFAAVEDGDTVELLPGEHAYLVVTSPLRNVRIVGRDGAVSKGIKFQAGIEDVTIENITIDTTTIGIHVQQSADGLTVRNCKFSLTNGHAIHAKDVGKLGYTYANIVVDNCVFNMADEMGGSFTAVYLGAVDGLTVTDNTFARVIYNGIQAAGTITGDVTVTGNTFAEVGSRNVYLSGITDEYTGTLTIEGNTFIEPVNPKTDGNFVKTGTTYTLPVGANYPTVDNVDGYYYKGVVPMEEA